MLGDEQPSAQDAGTTIHRLWLAAKSPLALIEHVRPADMVFLRGDQSEGLHRGPRRQTVPSLQSSVNSRVDDDARRQRASHFVSNAS